MKNLKYILFLVIFIAVAFQVNARDYRKPNTTKSTKNVTAGCLPASAQTNLDLNNVRALILAQGSLWEGDGKAEYEIPKGSLKTSLFAGGIWIGGVDVNGQLRTCARSYKGQGNDYWPGPLVKSGDEIASVSANVCNIYDQHFKITRQEVEEFKAYTEADAETKATDFEGYTRPDVITNWPGNGPTEFGEYDSFLAPYFDANDDLYYNPDDGDYPYYVFDKNAPCKYTPTRYADNLGSTSQKLFGDMTIWWVYNDKGNIHTETVGAAAIGMEIRAQGFAFSTNDELNNMTFYNYQLINRSTYTLADAYFGIWNDPDLGNAEDDKAGCDVVRGLGYVYNGKEIDGNGLPNEYGEKPPAIGIDFFEGPYQDIPVGGPVDKLSSWKEQDKVTLDCNGGYGLDVQDSVWKYLGPGDINNGNINGLNFGDGVPGNERWGMRRFIYYLRTDLASGYNADPDNALDFYKYLTGFWRDGVRMTYGGNGHDGTKPADFMYPDDTDECGWGIGGDDSEDPWNMRDLESSADQRIVQSAGPFTLEPGAVNDITVGVVWARSTSTAWASVNEVRKADIKAQRLFENCFQLIDGPEAPRLNIVELDGKLIFHLYNEQGSNNYLEGYREKDPFIDPTASDKYYTFQGYQVYQYKDLTVTTGDLLNEDKARLVFQCDVKDGISQIINYTWDNDIQSVVPHEMVNGSDEGIVHTFELTTDAFGSGDTKNLINYNEYYYIAVAYAHNDYEHYDPVSEGTLGNQTTPYLAGRLGLGVDKNGKPYSATPQSVSLKDNGLVLNSTYGDVPEITMVDGKAGGANYLELSEKTKEEILSKSSYPYIAEEVTYQKNHGPITVKVVDPINVIDADFELRLLPDAVHGEAGYYFNSDSTNVVPKTGLILDTKWELSYENENGVLATVESDAWIRYADEKVIPELGISIEIEQVDMPGQRFDLFDEKDNEGNNGYIGGDIIYEDQKNEWLGFLPDVDGNTAMNWIRAGKQSAAEDEPITFIDLALVDPDQHWEGILGGTWAPYIITSSAPFGPAHPGIKPKTVLHDRYRIPSIDVVITKDRDLWTRVPVVELAENNEDGTNSLSEGGAPKFNIRRSPSRDKDGNFNTTVAPEDLNDPNSPNYIKETGMSWFPGYAIDVETGERLNMAFGEDSWLVGENGNDMLWNPTSTMGDNIFNNTGGTGGTPYLGGKHFIYVFTKNDTCDKVLNCLTMPSYDEGRTLAEYLDVPDGLSSIQREDYAAIWRHCGWTAIPLVRPGQEFYSYEDMPESEVSISLRMANPYMMNINKSASESALNNNYPMFRFSTSALSAKMNSTEFAKSALEKVNIVPNPYYGYSQYELTQLDNFVKIINLPERCIVSIYTANGNLVRKFDKDNSDTFIQWDLKNQYEVTIASGMYIIHISAPTIGEEKILKWFGSLRPTDLNAF